MPQRDPTTPLLRIPPVPQEPVIQADPPEATIPASPILAASIPPAPSSDTAALQSYLAIKPSVCPVCRYELGELRDDHCPECGSALRLILTARRSPRQAVSARLWLIGLVGPSTAVGVLTLEFARIAISRWVGLLQGTSQSWWMLWNRALLLAAGLVLMYAWTEMREHFPRLSPIQAMLLAQSVWLLAVGLLAISQYVLI